MIRRGQSTFAAQWSWPIGLAALTLFGLFSALIGEGGVWWWLSWAALAIPLVVIAHHLRRARQRRPHHARFSRLTPSEGAMSACNDSDPVFDVLPLPTERYGHAPPPQQRVLGVVSTSCIYAIVAAGVLLSFGVSAPSPQPSNPLAVTMLPLASPPKTPPKPREARKPVEKKQKPSPAKVDPIKRTISPITTMLAPQPQPVTKPAPMPQQAETAAPKTVQAPSAPQVSSNAPDTWEGRVLARLEKFQRYPGAARSARQQGVAYIRFRINRDGHVLSSALVRSSGFPALDQAALETLRRADPLPQIPADRPEEIELSVPVEFYIR